jgi:hypothetical protein
MVTQPSAPHCAHHPGVVAEWYCPRCTTPLCAQCVRKPDASRSAVVACSSCGLPVQHIDIAPLPEHKFEDHRPFIPRLIDAPLYPLRGFGWALILGALLLVTIVELLGGAAYSVFTASTNVAYSMPIGLFSTVIAPLALYLTAYLFRIVHDTAIGEHTVPDWPDITELWPDILRPNLLILGVLLISFAPALAALFMHADSPVFYALVIVGVLYFPMALLAVAAHDHLLAANPFTVLLAIIRVLPGYGITLLVFAFFESILAGSIALLHRHALAGALLTAFTSTYLLILTMHILGQLYHAHRFTLHWLHREEIQPLDPADDDTTPPESSTPTAPTDGPIDLA